MNKLRKVSPEEVLTVYHRVMTWFFAYPAEDFTLNELHTSVGMAKTTAREAVNLLLKDGFLDIKTIGRLWRIRANPKHEYFYTKKIAYNLAMVYESRLLDQINKNHPNSLAVVLFGSYRKGDDIPESDLDIAVEILGGEPIKVMELGVISQFGYRQNVKVNLHVFSRNKIDLNVFSNIANGIVLQGFLEVRP
ncbi:nucleotidyltransferase domain-containing protein [Candidatus Woesearchaeota archaeon]|nr:nucleotidyltransferase domain-containing protein [Candidatus Woesearchaeota archaeon]